MANGKTRLCFLSAMVGRHPGYVTTQGLIVADLFAAAGHPVFISSTSLNRYVRPFDMVGTLLRHRHEIDIVVADLYGGASFVIEDMVSAAARLLGLPLIFVIHGGVVPEQIAQHPTWARRILSRADALVAPSGYMVEMLGRQGYQATQLSNVVDLSLLDYRPRQSVRPIMLWMRSFHEIYQPEMAVRVLARLAERYPDARLIMAGAEKGQRAAVVALAADLGVTDRLSLPGFITNEQKNALAHEADIFLNTSRIDNMPVALIEAGAMGMPIVTTNAGGIPYLIKQGETGLMVEIDDLDGMVTAVTRLVETPALAAALSSAGRAMAEQSSWQQVQPQWRALFDKVLRSRNSR